MKEKWQHIFKHNDCHTIEELTLYHEGKLPAEQRFRMEHHLTGCEICSDLLEGISIVDNSDKILKAENDIRSRLEKFLQDKKRKTLGPYFYQKLSIAASILLLISSGILLYFINQNQPTQLAQKAEKINLNLTPGPDTLAELAEKRIAETNELSGSISKSKNSEKTKSEKRTMENMEIASSSAAIISEEKAPELKEDQGKIESQNQTTEESKKAVEISPGINQQPKSSSERNVITGIKTVSGKILAEDGSPLPGATVQIKGTNRGTVTDLDGKYSLEVPDSNGTLCYSYVGYLAEEVPVESRKNIDIKLTTNISTLDEVVVIGYGTQKKMEVTGAISKASSEESNKRKSKKVDRTLQGKTAGVEVTDNTIPSSANPEIRIRGVSSIQETGRNLQIDSLKSALIVNNFDKSSRIKLIGLYLEMKSESDAMRELYILQNQTTDKNQLNIILDVIEYTKKSNYSKALKRFKKIQ